MAEKFFQPIAVELQETGFVGLLRAPLVTSACTNFFRLFFGSYVDF